MQRQRELDLTGKVAIITGASRGVGRRAALDLAQRGAKVVLAARTVDPDDRLPGSLGQALETLESMGADALAVATDVAKSEDLERLVKATVNRFGGVDILVNNAAVTVGPVWEKKSFLELTREEWLQQFDVNLHAPFTLMQLVAPSMASRGGGRILNVTTSCGEVFRLSEEPREGEQHATHMVVPGYFASKRALDRLGSVIAPELAKSNIHVIGLMPGWVATELVSASLEGVSFERDGLKPIPMEVPSRMLVYFASCENPSEYTGRLFWAERELAAMDIELV